MYITFTSIDCIFSGVFLLFTLKCSHFRSLISSCFLNFLICIAFLLLHLLLFLSFLLVFYSWWVSPCMTFSQAQVYSCVTDLSCWTFYYLAWCSVTVTEISPASQYFSSVFHWQLSYYLFPDACQSLLWAVVCQLCWGFLGLVFLLNASFFISSIFPKPSLFSLGYIVYHVL